jgi:predicted Zn-dependent protease
VLLLIGLGALGATAAAAIWSGGRNDRERAEALQAASAGDFASAEPGLKRAYEHSPQDAEVVAVLARAYQAADHPEAEVWLSRWVELAPDRDEPVRLRMEYFRKRKDGAKVLADVRRLLQLDPGNAQLRRTAMSQAFSYGEFEEAERLCRDCLQAQPADPWLNTMLAEIRRARGDAAGAAAILDALIRQNPRATGPLLARAVLYQESGEPGQAVPLLERVFRHDPRQRRAAGYQLSIALDRCGRPDEARKVLSEVRRLQDVEVFGEAIKSQPDNLDLQVRLAESLLGDGHVQDGLDQLQAVLNRDPWFRPAHRALADYFQKSGQPARAAEHRRLAGR